MGIRWDKDVTKHMGPFWVIFIYNETF